MNNGEPRAPPHRLFSRQEKRKERLEEETKELRRIAARRRTRDLLLERAKQRLLAAAVAAAVDGAAPNDATQTGQSDGGGGSFGDKASLLRGGLRDGKVAADFFSEDGSGAGMPLYAQETLAARHSKVRLVLRSLHYTSN